MNEITTERNLDTIAGEINTIKGQAQAYIMHSCIEIGGRLCEAKHLIGHGNWLGWLRDSVGYGERTAQNLMLIYKKFGVEGNQTKLIGTELDASQIRELTYTQMTALLKIKDDDERADFMAENPVQDMSTRELEAKIKELKEQKAAAEKEKASYETRLAESAKEIGTLKENAKKKEAAGEAEREKLRKEIEEIKARPIETAVILEIPEETKKKMEADERVMGEMRSELEQLKARAGKSEEEIRFAVAFESAKKDIQAMGNAVRAITDEEKRERYKAAAQKFFRLMAEAM